jgi:hypothetical protein
MRRGRAGVVVRTFVAGALVVSLSGCDVDAGAPGETARATPGGKNSKQARQRLDDLRVESAGSMTGYERTRFGQRWKDTDHNGCDQRNDILARDLEKVRKTGRCVVVAGRLHDPYTGKDLTFAKSHAAEVQIDHIYPLALAWRMGASDWTAGKREQFANDRDNLLAVWGRPNQQKGDSGPAEWQPQKSYQCAYAVKFVAVADEYALPVTRADHATLGDFLSRC